MCVYVSICVNLSMMNGWLVGWLVFSQSNYFVDLLSMLPLRFFSLSHSSKVLFFFFFLATVWHFHLPSHFLVKDHPKSQLSRKTSDLHLECEMMSSLIQLSLSFSFVVGFMSQYYLWLGHFPRLALSKSQLY